MPKTPALSATLLLCTMLTAACGTVPLAVHSPKPAEPPAVLLEPVSTQPPLIERYRLLMQELQDSLRKAIVQ